MKSPLIPRGIYIGFGGVAVLFLALYVLLSYHNRPAADDFYFLTAVRTKGTWLTAVDAYNTWITRWSALLFLGFCTKLFDAGQSLLLFQLFTLVALTAGTGLLIRKMVLAVYGTFPAVSLVILYALLFVLTFFFLTFNTGETWFWFTSECMYLWPVIALLFGSCLLLSKEIKIFSLVLFACLLFIGGGSEVVALETLLLLMLIRIRLRIDKPFMLSAFLNKRLLSVSIGVVILSLFIAWIGPGRALRQGALVPAALDRQLLLSIKAVLFFFLAQLPLKIHWMVFCTVPWLVLKNQLLPGDEKPVPIVFRGIARDFLIFMLFVCVHFAIVAFLLRSFPPFRTWITVSLALSIFCVVTGWRLGYLVHSKKGIAAASILFMLVAGMLLVENISSQDTTISAYSNAVDERMTFLKNNTADEKPVINLKPLPPPGMLYSAEISSDTNYFTNKQLREYLELKVPVGKQDEH